MMFLHARGRGSGRELARVLGVGPSAVSQLVDRLVAHGQVQRAEAPDDRRITWLTLTPAGQATAERLVLEGRERLAEALALLAPAEQARVAEAFELLAAAAARLPCPPEEPGC
jgi:DNA-binding MarR family transcriptional regulator